MKNLKLILIIFIAGAVSLTLEAKKIDLKYNLKKGAEIKFEISTIQEMGQEMMGQFLETNSSLTQTIKFHVKDITPEGNYVIVKTIVKYKIISGSDAGDMELDSETVGENTLMMQSLKWVLEPVTFVMNPKGEILEVYELDAKVDRFKEMTENPTPEFQLIASMAPQFASASGIRNSVSAMLLSFPEGKVKTGKPWESVSSMKQLVNFVNTSMTQINEVNGDIAVLTQDVKIEVGEGENIMKMKGMEMEYELEGEKKAEFTVDMKTGLVETSEGVTQISGVITVDSPQLPAPMDFPMTIQITDKIKRVK